MLKQRTAEEASLQELEGRIQAAIVQMKDLLNNVTAAPPPTPRGGRQVPTQVTQLRDQLWRDISDRCNASPLIAQRTADQITKQLQTIRSGLAQKPDDVLLYTQDTVFLMARLAEAEQQSCVIQLRGYDRLRSKCCTVVYNHQGKGNTSISVPFLRCGVKLLGESNIDFDGALCQALPFLTFLFLHKLPVA